MRGADPLQESGHVRCKSDNRDAGTDDVGRHGLRPVARVRIGMRDDPDLLDPTLSRTYVGTLVMTAICDKLFDFDANQTIVPVLATGYEWTDCTNLLIHIRPGVRFQDGEPLDAASVSYTLE